MKITVITSPDYDEPEEVGRLTTKLQTDKFSDSASFGRGEPEDNSLNRDLSDAWSIAEMLRAAYEAGIRGEAFEIKEIEE